MSKTPDTPDTPDTDPFAKRKEPRQRRSRSTVESIKQAALLLLNEEGLQGCGADRIALRAGVSIGSLYQYFPNRESILIALYEDISTKHIEILKRQLPRLMDLPTEAGVAKAMELLLSMHDSNQLLLLQLAIDMPQLRLGEHALSFVTLTRSVVRAYLISRARSIKPRDVERMVFFLQQIILGCISGYLRNVPPGLTRKAFTRDLSRIVSSYIEGDSALAGSAHPEQQRADPRAARHRPGSRKEN